MLDLSTTTRAYVRPAEVAEYFSVHRRTVYLWIETGRLPAAQMGGCVRISIEVIRAIERGDYGWSPCPRGRRPASPVPPH